VLSVAAREGCSGTLRLCQRNCGGDKNPVAGRSARVDPRLCLPDASAV